MTVRTSVSVLAAAILTTLASSAPAAGALPDAGDPRCAALADLRLPDTEITAATTIPAGAWANTPLRGGGSLPAFCRVTAHVRSDPGSDIAVEVWLPLDDWQGVFHGTGNGGFAGTLAAGYPSMASGLKRGFATATTDTGTAPATALDGEPLIGQPRKWKDWGRLSTHVMTETGKAVAKAFYRREASTAYYTGCSTGGQQGLIEALHYPDDYDGILVAAPVINRTWGHAAVLWDYAAAHRTPASTLSDSKLVLLNRAAIAKCGRLGGGVASDPWIADPFACRFDPGELACRKGGGDQCLSPAEVTTARAFYSGPVDDKGAPSFFGWLPGSELPARFGWSFLQSTGEHDQPPFGTLFKWVFGPSWDWRQADLQRDMPTVDALLDGDLNDATRGNLQAFAARGGKLILHHGLADALVPPGQTLDFYRRQVRALGGLSRARQTARLFLAPGVMHCGDGAGPDSFDSTLGIPPLPPSEAPDGDLFYALTEWVEHGTAPERVIATKFADAEPGKVLLQRPLCAYPKKARYRRGPLDSAASFTCS